MFNWCIAVCNSDSNGITCTITVKKFCIQPLTSKSFQIYNKYMYDPFDSVLMYRRAILVVQFLVDFCLLGVLFKPHVECLSGFLLNR